MIIEIGTRCPNGAEVKFPTDRHAYPMPAGGTICKNNCPFFSRASGEQIVCDYSEDHELVRQVAAYRKILNQ